MPQLNIEELKAEHLATYWAICAVDLTDKESRILWESRRLAPAYDPRTEARTLEHVEIFVPTMADEHLRPIKAKIAALQEELNSVRDRTA